MSIGMMYSKAEEIRIRYLYRDLVLKKKIRLPLEGAIRIVGPDCAYHLYALSGLKRTASDKDNDGDLR